MKTPKGTRNELNFKMNMLLRYMLALLSYKQGSELPRRHCEKGNAVNYVVPVMIKQTCCSGQAKLWLILRPEGISSEPFVEKTQCGEEQPPRKIPTESLTLH